MPDSKKTPEGEDRFVLLREMCERLGGRHRATIYRMQKRKELKLRKCAGRTGMLESEFSQVLAGLPIK
jgi:hypothetical protein